MKTLFVVLLLTLVGCGSSTVATTSDDDDSGSRPGQDFFDVTPVATTEPTPEESPTPVGSPTPEPTPVFENCHTDKFTVCHVPDEAGTDPMWLCVDEDGKDMHLLSHEEDYLFGDEGTACP